MAKTKVNRDVLKVSTRSTNGQSATMYQEKAVVSVSVAKSELLGRADQRSNRIVVDISGDNGTKRREDALINIDFSDGTFWSGSFQSLQQRLNPSTLHISITPDDISKAAMSMELQISDEDAQEIVLGMIFNDVPEGYINQSLIMNKINDFVTAQHGE